MANPCVIGRGFLGGALAKRFAITTPVPTSETKVLFYFAGHVHPIFERNPHFEMQRVYHDFGLMLPYCKDHGILFVYTSSALVYEQETQFSVFKKTLESMALNSGAVTLGLRIFPVFGPREHRTVISQWCRAMMQYERPKVYGDGTQKRDFIFVEDVVDQVLTLVNEKCWKSRVVDIGTGKATAFNDIVGMINAELGTDLQPEYVTRPSSYSEGIVCKNPMPCNYSVESGIHYIIEGLRREQGKPLLERVEMCG